MESDFNAVLADADELLNRAGIDSRKATPDEIGAALKGDQEGRSYEQSARATIDDVLSSLDSGKARGKAVPIGKVSPWLVEQARSVGIDLAGYSHALDPYGVQHALKNHGDAAKEATRGQVGITLDDFRQIPELLAAPDYVILGGTGRAQPGSGRLRQGAGRWLDALSRRERTGREQLAALTMRKFAPDQCRGDCLDPASQRPRRWRPLKIVPAEVSQAWRASIVAPTNRPSTTARRMSSTSSRLTTSGSGEGAQAYGWGLYFAGNKAVAKYYRETLARGEA